METQNSGLRIPLENAYRMFLYAENITTSLMPASSAHMDEFELAKALGTHLFHCLSAEGWSEQLSHYVDVEDETDSPKGRIDFNKTIIRGSHSRHKIYCQFDEIQQPTVLQSVSYDAVLALLPRLNRFSELQSNLVRLGQELSYVPLQMNISPSLLLRDRDDWTSDQRILLHVCALVECLSGGKDGQEINSIQIDFLDPVYPRLWEKFCLGFWKEHSGYKVEEQKFTWQNLEGDETTLRFVPKLIPDIVIHRHNSIIVADAKLYREPLFERQNKNGKSLRFRREHLNQLYAYMKNIEIKNQAEGSVDGIIIYGSTMSFCYDFRIGSHYLRFVCVKIDATWEEIQASVKNALINLARQV